MQNRIAGLTPGMRPDATFEIYAWGKINPGFNLDEAMVLIWNKIRMKFKPRDLFSTPIDLSNIYKVIVIKI